MPDLDAAALKEMEKEIAAEGDLVGIELPKNPKSGDIIPLFAAAIEIKTKLDNIVLYSLATGILRYQTNSAQKINTEYYYSFYNPDIDSIGLTVLLDKKRKDHQAAVSTLFTKTDVENREIRAKETRKKNLVSYMNGFEKKLKN